MHVNQRNTRPWMGGGGVPVEMTTVAEVLTRAGYVSRMVGKWHAGMSSMAHLPINRGFESSFGILGGATEHEGHLRRTEDDHPVRDMWRNDRPAYNETSTFSSHLYTGEAVKVIQQHDSTKPLFLYIAFQMTHGPLQAPEEHEDKFPEVAYKKRRLLLQMALALDDAVKAVLGALHSRGMWDDALVVFASDNGGAAGAGNNYPLRGAKSSDLEGGVRVVAAVNGGFLPRQKRGTTEPGYMHIADMYATFAALAGVKHLTDTRAARFSMPPIDSMNMWPLISGVNATSPRTEIPLSVGPGVTSAAVIRGRYKVIRGRTGASYFSGPRHPNASATDGTNTPMVCSPGCLFDIVADPTEHHDMSEAQPELLHALLHRLDQLEATTYQSPSSPDVATQALADFYGDFLGPWEQAPCDRGVVLEVRDDAPIKRCRCADNCSRCLRETPTAEEVCLTCTGRLYLLGGKCVEAHQCPPHLPPEGTGEAGRTCAEPPSCVAEVNTDTALACTCDLEACADCQLFASGPRCTRCRKRRFLHEGRCVSTCPSGMAHFGAGSHGRECLSPFNCTGYVNQETGEACTCGTGCLHTCTVRGGNAPGEPPVCHRCKDNWFLLDGSCRRQCPDGFVGRHRDCLPAGTPSPTTTPAATTSIPLLTTTRSAATFPASSTAAVDSTSATTSATMAPSGSPCNQSQCGEVCKVAEGCPCAVKGCLECSSPQSTTCLACEPDRFLVGGTCPKELFCRGKSVSERVDKAASVFWLQQRLDLTPCTLPAWQYDELGDEGPSCHCKDADPSRSCQNCKVRGGWHAK